MRVSGPGRLKEGLHYAWLVSATLVCCWWYHSVSSWQPAVNKMYGLIAKVTTVPGKRDEMIAILKESAADMPGCFTYIVAKDAADENILWVTEVWDSLASHDVSLSLPQVKSVIPRAKTIVAHFEKVAVTTPVWGVGLPQT